MDWLCRIALASAFMALVLTGASAAPDYIEAQPGRADRGLREEVANRAFSDEFTEARTTIIKGSIVAAHECPADPEFVLRDLYPFSADPTDVIWLERYEVDCKEKLRRAILMLLKDGRSPPCRWRLAPPSPTPICRSMPATSSRLQP